MGAHGPAGRDRLAADADRLRQILVNLPTNAVKFTERGKVRLDVRATPGGVRFAVSGTGIGIAQAELERIFQPFTQIDQSRTRTAGGTGLGLPVNRRLAHRLGGVLDVASTPGQGSTFEPCLDRDAVPER